MAARGPVAQTRMVFNILLVHCVLGVLTVVSRGPVCVGVVGSRGMRRMGLRVSACVVLHAYIVVSVAGAFVIVCTLLACRCVSLGDVRREGA